MNITYQDGNEPVIHRRLTPQDIINFGVVSYRYAYKLIKIFILISKIKEYGCRSGQRTCFQRSSSRGFESGWTVGTLDASGYLDSSAGEIKDGLGAVLATLPYLCTGRLK